MRNGCRVGAEWVQSGCRVGVTVEWVGVQSGCAEWVQQGVHTERGCREREAVPEL